MNDSLIVYIENDIFDKIENGAIMEHCQSIKMHRKQL